MSWICTDTNDKFLDHFETMELARDSWRLTYSAPPPDEPVFRHGCVYFRDELIGYCYNLPARDKPALL